MNSDAIVGDDHNPTRHSNWLALGVSAKILDHNPARHSNWLTLGVSVKIFAARNDFPGAQLVEGRYYFS